MDKNNMTSSQKTKTEIENEQHYKLIRSQTPREYYT